MKQFYSIILLGFLLGHSPVYAIDTCQTVHQKAAHDSITSDLSLGQIVSAKRFSENGNLNQLFAITIRAFDPFTRKVRYREAFFKPREFGDKGGFARTPMAYVAYFLNRRLGMDYVPTAYRRGLNLKIGDQTFTEGAVIFKAPDFVPLSALPDAHFSQDHEAIISDNRVLSVLLQNRDAHPKNMGSGKHWVDGSIQSIFLDFDASLMPDTNVTMTYYPVEGNSTPVTKVRLKTFLALKKLSNFDLQPLVDGNFISESERKKILSIAQGIVNYFQGLVDEKIRQGITEGDVFISP